MPTERCGRRGVPRRGRGFTLIELVISAALVGFLAVTAAYFWVSGFELDRRVNSDSAGIANGRIVLDRLAREIREMKYNASSGAYCVQTPLSSTALVFSKSAPASYATGCGGYSAPTNSNADFAVTVQVPTGSTSLQLKYDGALASPATNSVLATNVTTFEMRYLDASYAATTSATALRFVRIDMTISPPDAPETQTRTVVALRNN